MTEDQIERQAERMMDHLDRLLLAGQMTQETYDKAVRDLDQWCEAKRMGAAPKNQVFTFHTDAGHGWLQVTHYDMTQVGLKPRDFSRYSYRGPRDETTYYLEEDCDASRFAEAWERKHGRKLPTVDTYVLNSPIRCYPRIW